MVICISLCFIYKIITRKKLDICAYIAYFILFALSNSLGVERILSEEESQGEYVGVCAFWFNTSVSSSLSLFYFGIT